MPQLYPNIPTSNRFPIYKKTFKYFLYKADIFNVRKNIEDNVEEILNLLRKEKNWRVKLKLIALNLIVSLKMSARDTSYAIGSAFLKQVIRFYPYKINHILTDNGFEFSFKALPKNKKTKRVHPFNTICKENKIQHRTIKFKHPWTNGNSRKILFGRLRKRS